MSIVCQQCFCLCAAWTEPVPCVATACEPINDQNLDKLNKAVADLTEFSSASTVIQTKVAIDAAGKSVQAVVKWALDRNFAHADVRDAKKAKSGKRGQNDELAQEQIAAQAMQHEADQLHVGTIARISPSAAL